MNYKNYTPKTAYRVSSSYTSATKIPSFATPSANKNYQRSDTRQSLKMNEMKRNIDDLIGNIVDKRNLQGSAVSQVYKVNKELENYLGENQYNSESPFEHKKFNSQVNTYPGSSYIQNDKIYRNLETENSRLKQILNNQMSYSNQLIQNVNALQQENMELKSQRPKNYELEQENMRLKQQIGRKENQTYNYIIQQLDCLKNDNQTLRMKTVQLLKHY